MQCSIAGLVALIFATIALIAGAIVAGNYGPVGWLIAAGLAGAAILMLAAIDASLRAYVNCRDRAGRTDRCSTSSINNHFPAIGAVLGIAFTSFLTAAAVFWNIFVGGPVAAAVALIAAIVACAIAIVLLLSLLAFVIAYSTCRDREPARPPIGTGTGGLIGEATTTGTTTITIKVPEGTKISISQ